MRNNTEAAMLAKDLVRQYGTHDPFRLCEYMDIYVLMSDFKYQKGVFRVINNFPFIFINENLSLETQRMICAHELGHAMLHKDLANQMGGLIETELFAVTNSCEVEANQFAAALLIEDGELLDLLHEGYDLLSCAREMSIHMGLLSVRLKDLAEINKDLRPSVHMDTRFLGSIGENAGSY